MENKTCFRELNEDEILKLPYTGPMSRRIYAITVSQGSVTTKELFVQRTDAFTTDLLGLLKSVKERDISEIRYSCGFDEFIRIFLNERGKLMGEYTCNSEKTLQEFKRKLAGK
jgi:hypothetical protein